MTSEPSNGPTEAHNAASAAAIAALAAQLRPTRKNRGVAVLLAVFLGWFGAHKFYLGQTGWGIVYLLFCWTFIPACVALIEALFYLLTDDYEFGLKYG